MRASIVRLFAFILLGAHAHAQSAHWDPAGGSLPAGQTSALQLVFEDCEPKDTPVPPRVGGLSLQYSGQSTNMSFVNGTYSHTVSFTYAALLAKKQAVEIPPFEVETNKGAVRVPPARFDPVGATVGGSQPLESAAHGRLEITPASVWAGEVFQVDYTIQAARSYYPDFGHGALDWNSEPLVIEDWPQPEPFDDRSGAEPQTGLAYRTRAIARKPGSATLNPINQLVNLSVGVAGFGFFQQRQYQQFSVTSTTPTIEVRPLPPAPAGFSGAVGDFKLTGKVVPTAASVGEPITWTLELTGTGNWPDIAGLPARDVSKDFQVIQPKAKRVLAAGKLFDSKLTEDVVLVPTQAGTYSLAPVRFIYFDPKSATYETVTAPGAMVTISSPKAENAAPSQGSPAVPGGNPPPSAASPSLPSLPAGLLRDPLPAADAASKPWDTACMAAALSAPFILLVVFWFWLAWQRARLTDPARPLREARNRLAETLAGIRSALEKRPSGSPPLASLLHAWQRDSAMLWQVAHAAPLPSAIPDPQWAALWVETDRALYSDGGGLASDWVARAEAALAGRRIPPFAWYRLFIPHNLFPFIAVILIVNGLALAAFAAEAADQPSNPARDYRRGDFAAAEKGWRSELSRTPTAWAARHNLSLSLAQQDRWDEAAAQAAAAFAQEPGDAAIRWQFALACDKAGFAPTSLAPFLSPGPLAQWAALASPAVWQRTCVAATGLAAAAIGVLLAFGFGLIRRGRRRVFAAYWALGLAVALGVTASLGSRAYGLAADSKAVIVWRSTTLRSIPTEADTSQKTVPLPAGSLARADRSFLGWMRLNFENGQTGWVRTEELVWLWR